MRFNNTVIVRCSFCKEKFRIEPDNGDFDEYVRARREAFDLHSKECENWDPFDSQVITPVHVETEHG